MTATNASQLPLLEQELGLPQHSLHGGQALSGLWLYSGLLGRRKELCP